MTAAVPVALFAYDRVDHLKNTVEHLAQNAGAENTMLIVFSDGAKHQSDASSVERVRTYLRSIKWFSSIKIVESETNQGLSRSIIGGVTRVLDESNAIIVLEDDMVTSKYFLQYMNDFLGLYQDEPRVASIHGYCYPIRFDGLPETFFVKGADCWGWGTWKRAWNIFSSDGRKLHDRLVERKLMKRFNFDYTYDYEGMLLDQILGRNDSWAVRWYASALLNGMLTLYPRGSFVRNIGNDLSGTHMGKTDAFDVKLNNAPFALEKTQIEENAVAVSEFKRFFIKTHGRLPFLKRYVRNLFL